MLATLVLLAACGGSAPVPTPDAPAPEAPAAAAAPEAPAAAAAPADQAALLAQVQGTVEVMTNEMSGQETGKTVTRAEAGEIAGVPCVATVSAWNETWGCATTAAFTRDGYTTSSGTYAAVHYGTGKRAALMLDTLVPAVERLDVNGVPCREFVHFHPNGAIKGCTLAGAHAFGPVTLPEGSNPTVNAEGVLTEAMVYADLTVGGKTHPGGQFTFDASGAVTHVAEGFFGD